jgi:hypothetical protein
MLTFEIRLLIAEDRTVTIHVTARDTVEEAKERLAGIKGVSFARYEIWQSGRKVSDGLAP